MNEAMGRVKVEVGMGRKEERSGALIKAFRKADMANQGVRSMEIRSSRRSRYLWEVSRRGGKFAVIGQSSYGVEEYRV